jgi:hypothetical protein
MTQRYSSGPRASSPGLQYFPPSDPGVNMRLGVLQLEPCTEFQNRFIFLWLWLPTTRGYDCYIACDIGTRYAIEGRRRGARIALVERRTGAIQTTSPAGAGPVLARKQLLLTARETR